MRNNLIRLNTAEVAAVNAMVDGDLPSDFQGEDAVKDQTYYSGVALHMACTAGVFLNERRDSKIPLQITYKDDRTPVTDADIEAGGMIRGVASRYLQGYTVEGEEQLERNSRQLATPNERKVGMDALDGTKPYILGFPDMSSSNIVTLGNNGEVIASTVFDITQMEVFHRAWGTKSRLLRLLFPRPTAHVLPFAVNAEVVAGQGKIVTRPNIHVNGRSQNKIHKLSLERDLGPTGEIGAVTDAYGSPALSIVKLAKRTGGIQQPTGGAYVHEWQGETDLGDLAAAMDILRGADGVVWDRDGNDIPLDGHEGLVVAATSEKLATMILDVIGG